MDMGYSIVREFMRVPPSLDITLNCEVTYLPPDFVKTFEIWTTAAITLIEAPPDVLDYGFQAQVVDALAEIVHTIDKAVESLDLNHALLPQVRRLLYYQYQALQRGNLLLPNADSIRRVVYILEVLPHFCDRTDTELSRFISRKLYILLSNSFVNSNPSEIKLSQMLKSCGIPSSFITDAKSIVELADHTSQFRTEVRDCNLQSPIIRDLDWVVATVDRIIGYYDSSDEYLEVVARLLIVQVVALQARFRLLGNIANLHRSIYIFEITSQFHIPTSDLSHFNLLEFAFTGHETSESLSARIAIGEELLRHPCVTTRMGISGELTNLLQQRCERKDNIPDRMRILQLCEEVLLFVTGDDRLDWLERKLFALNHLSRLGQQLPDLSPGFQFLDECPTAPEVDKAEFLWFQLKNATVSGNEQAAVSILHKIRARDYRRHEISLAIFSIEPEAYVLFVAQKLRQMCIARSQKETFKPFAIVLVLALFHLYVHGGDMQYFREAFSIRSRLGPPGSYGFDHLIYGRAVTTDFNHMEKRSDLVKAFAASPRGSVFRCPETSGWKHSPGKRDGADSEGWEGWLSEVVRSMTFNDTAGTPSTVQELAREAAYLRTGDDWDFHITHRELLLRLSDSYQRHWDTVLYDHDKGVAVTLFKLGFLYSGRYTRQNNIRDLEQAIDWYQQSIDSVPEDEQTRSAWDWRTAWADKLFELHEATSSIEYPRLLQAHDYYRQAADSAHHDPHFRLKCIEKWLSHFAKFEGDRMVYVFDVLELALSLLEEQSWSASSPRFSIDARHENKLLSDLIPHLALCAGTSAMDSPNWKMIEIIEASQALIWTQLRRLRTPLDNLATVSPELASHFQQLSRRLESRIFSLDANPKGDVEPLGTNNWQLHQNMNHIIHKIRALPGFEKFLRRRAFGVNELNELVKDGPVVILLESGHALILLRNNHHLIELPVTHVALRNLHHSFRSTAKARDTHGGSEFAEGPISISTHPAAGPSNARAGMKVERNASKLKLEDSLEILWRQVVEPVLEVILRCRACGKGKSRVWEIPRLEDRPRIWWHCMGEFSFFPIHAAGIYSGGSQICLSDFFVSSYTPTLTALLDARERPIPPEIKILAAAQPNPEGRWTRLTEAEDELKEIIQATPPAHLISLGPTDQPDFEGNYTTVENVLKKLPEASVLHLACHGTQDTTDPLRSGFILADGKRLTIEELIKYRLPNAHTAILSACHTASNDAKQPDEAINLSSALMFLGFSNILATKWPMYDSDGPIIAKTVYQALFNTTQQQPQLEPTNDPSPVDPQVPTGTKATRNSECAPTLASFSLARVVDGITRHLRLEKKVPATRWATFVHVGI